MGRKLKAVLTIAGSDSSGGAGIQADLKAMTLNGVFAMSAITALTAQNTTGVQGIYDVSPEFVKQQIDSVFEDIRPDAVKIGMVASSPVIRAISERIQFYRPQIVVVDPVMVATSGAKLIEDEAIETLKSELFPLATLLTPNIPEAEVLTGLSIKDEEGIEEAARTIAERFKCSVLCKGGHAVHDANDCLCHHGLIQWFYGRRIENPNTHGTGCTLSSCIAANLAKGFSMNESIYRSKKFLSGALAYQLDLGRGSGPMHHGFDLKRYYQDEEV